MTAGADPGFTPNPNLTPAPCARRGWALAAAGLVVLLLAAFPATVAGRGSVDGTPHLRWSDALHGPPSGPEPRLPGGAYDNSAELGHQPWDLTTFRHARAGEPPLWQPDGGFGSPLLGNGQAAPLNPLKWLTLSASGGEWTPAFLLGRLLVAGLGTLALAAALGLSPLAGFLAGAGFMLNGMFCYHLPLVHVHTFVVLPWLVLAADALRRRPDLRRIGGLGLAIGVTGWLGHPEAAIVTGVAAAAVVAAGVAADRERALPRAAALAGAIALGAGVAAVMVLPFAEFVRESRSYLFDNRNPYPWLGLGHIGFYTLSHLITPLGRSVQFSAFVGAVPALLAGVGLLAPRVRPVALALAGVAAAIYGLCPPVGLLAGIEVLPNSFYGPPALALAVALLGGAGLDHLRAAPRGRAATLVAAGAAALGALLGAYVLGTAGLGFPAALGELRSAAAVVAAAAAVLTAWRLGGRTRPAAAALVGVACADLWLGARALAPELPPLGYPSTPVVARIQAAGGGYRASGLGEALLPNTNMAYGVASLDLQEAFHLRRHVAYMEALNRGAPAGTLTARFVAPRFDPALADLAGLRWLVLADAPRGAAARLALAGDPTVVEVGRQPGTALLERTTALPKARVLHAAEFVALGSEAAETRLAAGAGGWRARALIETPDGRPPVGWRDTPGPATAVEVVAAGAHRVELATAPSRPGWLVLNDAYYPGWEAEVDGRPAAILPAYVAFRAVALPAGRHRVVFRYAPGSVRAGAAVSVGAIAIALLLLLRPKRRKPRPARLSGLTEA